MEIALYAAYVFNIAILLPAAPSMFKDGAAFQGKIETPKGLSTLVGAFWSAILFASVAGLAFPRFFAPILIVQVIYKALWLAVFALPLARSKGWAALPMGVTIVFAAIIALYPALIVIGLRR